MFNLFKSRKNSNTDTPDTKVSKDFDIKQSILQMSLLSSDEKDRIKPEFKSRKKLYRYTNSFSALIGKNELFTKYLSVSLKDFSSTDIYLYKVIDEFGNYSAELKGGADCVSNKLYRAKSLKEFPRKFLSYNILSEPLLIELLDNLIYNEPVMGYYNYNNSTDQKLVDSVLSQILPQYIAIYKFKTDTNNYVPELNYILNYLILQQLILVGKYNDVFYDIYKPLVSILALNSENLMKMSKIINFINKSSFDDVKLDKKTSINMKNKLKSVSEEVHDSIEEVVDTQIKPALKQLNEDIVEKGLVELMTQEEKIKFEELKIQKEKSKEANSILESLDL